MADYCQLPLDVVVTILVRLSVMSLLRLRSVCKSWRSLIDSSPFINQHLLHEDANSNGCLIVKHHHLQKDWTLLSGQQFEVRETIDPVTYFSLGRDPPDNQGEWTILNSCNGIVCLSELWTYAEILCVALWNPATRQLACLPEPPPVPASKLIGHVRKNLGFGYAVKVDDYKVIRVVEFMSLDLPTSVLHHQAEIYNLSTNCWRNIDVNLPSGPCISSSNIYCNGRYFWDLSGLSPRTYSILSFDFSDEDFKIIILPDVLSHGDICLTTMRDCIACIDSKYSDLFRDGQFDIWVMTRYADKDSWTKLHTVRLIGPFTYVVLEGFSENGEILLLCDQTESRPELACTDLKTQQIQNLNILYMECAVYKESLVSIKKAMYPSYHPQQNDQHHVRTNISSIRELDWAGP